MSSSPVAKTVDVYASAWQAPAACLAPLPQVPAVSPNPKLLVNSFHCCICRLYRDERCLCNAADKGGPVKRRYNYPWSPTVQPLPSRLVSDRVRSPRCATIHQRSWCRLAAREHGCASPPCRLHNKSLWSALLGGVAAVRWGAGMLRVPAPCSRGGLGFTRTDTCTRCCAHVVALGR